jgi:hypothetical protein
MVMFVLVVAFLTLVVVASMLGWVADSRDGADWKPTEDGRRTDHRVGVC